MGVGGIVGGKFFPFVANGKLMVLGVLIFKHIRGIDTPPC